MNNTRRNKLSKIIDSLKEISRRIDKVMDEEIDSRDGMPENLQNSGQWEDMNANVEYLEEAIEHLDDVISCISATLA